MKLPAPQPATSSGIDRGIAYDVWIPGVEPPWPGIVVIHGAGSRKENHSDFARLAAASGWAALAYDQRGHGESEGEMSPAATADAGRMARVLGEIDGVDRDRVCVRGSSLGGFVAIHAAAVSPAIAGVAAVCPAGEQLLLRGIRRGKFEMRADADALVPWLEEHDLREAVEVLAAKPLLLLHARGDEEVPAAWSEELFERAAEPRKLVIVPGGHHRSVQHDPELQALTLSWLERFV